MARFNIFGAKVKYMGLFVGASICVLIWLNLSTKEGFQMAPVGSAQPVPINAISAEQKQAFAAGVIQLYNNIITAPPPIKGITTLAGGTPPPMPPMAPPAPTMPPMAPTSP